MYIALYGHYSRLHLVYGQDWWGKGARSGPPNTVLLGNLHLMITLQKSI